MIARSWQFAHTKLVAPALAKWYALALHERNWYGALALSSCLHVAFVCVLGVLLIEHLDHDLGDALLDSSWTEELQEDVDPIELLPELKKDPDQQFDAGGARHGVQSAIVKAKAATQVPAPKSKPSLAAAVQSMTLDDAYLADEVAIAHGNLTDNGDGDGQGDGLGDGEGSDFFGIHLPGKSYIYVVDCSNSMNHPHPSGAGTRFKRVKLELVRSIRNMEPEMKFYIIFFNQLSIPMPSRAMATAIPEKQLYFLNWSQRVKALGDTDPREALRLAIKMRPDVIYFLTDGNDFPMKVERELLAYNAGDTIIHTFKFVEPSTPEIEAGIEMFRLKQHRKAKRELNAKDYKLANRKFRSEHMLKRMAERYGGKFHLIP
ncbi:MAG: hypothetical protein CMJ78_00545 [Planctomycetaceae bacterium]|nr:hypothetical protein [Planctomycetaceae bacterium]